jgi:branched-chain amino acid transport system substrate-binding protein
MTNAMLGIESIRTAQAKYGKKPMTGEQVRWGIENLNLSAARLKELGFEGVIQPLKVTCSDHVGGTQGRMTQWDGKKWNFTSDWIVFDAKVIRPMIVEAAAKYAAEKKITPRDCSKEN